MLLAGFVPLLQVTFFTLLEDFYPGRLAVKDRDKTHRITGVILIINPTKCSFGVSAGQLLGFLVSARGIEANPEKIQAILTMGKPIKLHDIQKLTGRVAALSRFVTRLGEKALPFYALMKKSDTNSSGQKRQTQPSHS
jgi:hypothetical protein